MFMLGCKEQSGGVEKKKKEKKKKKKKTNEWEASRGKQDIMGSNGGKEGRIIPQSYRHEPGYHNELPAVEALMPTRIAERFSACFQLCDDAFSSWSEEGLNGLFSWRGRRIFSTHEGRLHPSVYHKHSNLKSEKSLDRKNIIWNVTKAVRQM